MLDKKEYIKINEKYRLFVQFWRPESNIEAVIHIVHGLGEYSDCYYEFARFFVKRNIAVIAFDQYGHGYSDGKRGDSLGLESTMNDIKNLLKRGKEIFQSTNNFLFGHSMGGTFVLNYLLLYNPKISGAIVTSPYLLPVVKPKKYKLLAGKLLYNILPHITMKNDLEKNALSRTVSKVESYKKDPLIHNRISVKLGIDLIESGKRALKRSGHLNTNLLLMHGKADRITSFEGSKKLYRKYKKFCDLKIWNGMYHELHNEPEKEQVLEFVFNWMKSRIKTYVI